MKQLLITIILLVISSGNVAAQKGLAVNELFLGRIIPKERMVVTSIRGQMLAGYKMTLFHSVKCEVNKEELERIDAAVQADANSAGPAFMTFEKRQRSTIRMLQLKQRGDIYPYICQKVEAEGKQWMVTLIYLETSVNSLSELKKMFNSK